jgi:hypothetical protein
MCHYYVLQHGGIKGNFYRENAGFLRMERHPLFIPSRSKGTQGKFTHKEHIMTKKAWSKGVVIVVMAVLLLVGCSKKAEAQAGGSSGSSGAVKGNPLENTAWRGDLSGYGDILTVSFGATDFNWVMGTQTLKGTYKVSGDKVIITADGESAEAFTIRGNTLIFYESEDNGGAILTKL